MLKKILIVLSLMLVTACSDPSALPEPQRAGLALAESSCLLFDPELSFDQIASASEDVRSKYGFETSEELEEYLDSLGESEEKNEVAIALREGIENFCGDALLERGLNPVDMSQAILSE
ncbi:MAG: hypothetical protein AAB802_03050 [Patescibacteria group bacterium]